MFTLSLSNGTVRTTEQYYNYLGHYYSKSSNWVARWCRLKQQQPQELPSTGPNFLSGCTKNYVTMDVRQASRKQSKDSFLGKEPARSGNWAFPSRLFSFVAELHKHYWELLMDFYSPSPFSTMPVLSTVSTNPKVLWRQVVDLHFFVTLLALDISICIPLSKVTLNLGWGHISIKHFTVSHCHFHTIASQIRTVRHALKEVVSYYVPSVECYEELSVFWCRKNKKIKKPLKGIIKEFKICYRLNSPFVVAVVISQFPLCFYLLLSHIWLHVYRISSSVCSVYKGYGVVMQPSTGAHKALKRMPWRHDSFGMQSHGLTGRSRNQGSMC